MGIEHTRPAAIDAGQTLEAVRMGAPPAKYTPAVHQMVCDLVKKGHRPVAAAQQAGITSHTFYRWMNMGKAGDPHLFDFANDVEQAVAIFEGVLVDTVVDASKEDAKHAEFLLERRFAEGYAKDVDAKVNGIMTDFITKLEAHLTPSEFDKVLTVISGVRQQSAPSPAQLEPHDASEPEE